MSCCMRIEICYTVAFFLRGSEAPTCFVNLTYSPAAKARGFLFLAQRSPLASSGCPSPIEAVFSQGFPSIMGGFLLPKGTVLILNA